MSACRVCSTPVDPAARSRSAATICSRSGRAAPSLSCGAAQAGPIASTVSRAGRRAQECMADAVQLDRGLYTAAATGLWGMADLARTSAALDVGCARSARDRFKCSDESGPECAMSRNASLRAREPTLRPPVLSAPAATGMRYGIHLTFAGGGDGYRKVTQRPASGRGRMIQARPCRESVRTGRSLRQQQVVGRLATFQ